MTRYVILRYHEIGLKGKNRPFFVDALVRNVRRAAQGLGVRRVWQGYGWVGAELDDTADWERVRAALFTVFGIVKMSLAHRLPLDIEKMKETVRPFVLERRFSSFRVATTRGDKSFPMTSPEVNAALGAFVKDLTGARVDLTTPDMTLYVDIMSREAYFYFDPQPGPGGLPVGTAGRVACLLSGGIDSPVAAYRMMKRGCRVTFIHFHSFPLVDGSSRDKALELVDILDKYQGRSRLYLVSFAQVQQNILLAVPPAYRVVLYRRFMLRIAEKIARQENAEALVTGESLGQVASQTLQNIGAIEAVVEKLPVFRPLIGMDKTEIIEQAEAIRTFPISILPDQDCCTLFVPRHPVTRYTDAEAAELEKALDVDGLVDAAVGQADLRLYEPEPVAR
jgi:thiamine biosynthesis protein ThiI